MKLRLSSLHLREVLWLSADGPLDKAFHELGHGRAVDATGGTAREILAARFEATATRAADERTAIEFRRLAAALRHYAEPTTGAGWELFEDDDAGRWAR